MRLLTPLALAAALSGCSPETAGGFQLYPQVSACSTPSCTPDLGFASNGTLWVVFEDNLNFSWEAWPAHLVGGHWQLGVHLKAQDEAQGRLLGMRDDSPVVSADGPVYVPTALASYGCYSNAAVVHYTQGTWIPKPVCYDRVALAPDGRLYQVGAEQYLSGDVHVSVLSPAWDAEESQALLLAEADTADPRQGLLAFSPSSEPVFEYLAATSSRTVLGFRKWDGTSWVPAAPDLDVGAAGLAGAVRAFKVDSQGRIWVTPGEPPATAWRWSGTAWEDMGGFTGVAPSPDGLPRIATALDAEDRFVVAWISQGDPSTLSMRRYGPGGWEDLGPPIEEPGWHISSVGMTINPDQTPVVAWVPIEEKPLFGIPNWKTKVARYVGD